MLGILSFMAEGSGLAATLTVIKFVLLGLMLVAAGFIIFIVMKQSGNSDGMEAFTGSSSRDQDSYYGKNSSKTKEGRLKIWTYIAAGVLAFCALVFVILTAVIK